MNDGLAEDLGNDNVRVYKICGAAEWEAMSRTGRLEPSPADQRDGFVHLSAPDQVRATAAKHFSGRGDLILLAIDSGMIVRDLRWEPSRGGTLFPHLYGELRREAVLSADPLPLDAAGAHVFPDGTP